MAFGHRSLGRLDEARREAQRAFDLCTQRLQLQPDDALVFFDRALANELLSDWSAALDDYRAAVQREPNLFVAQIGVIRMSLTLGRLPDAIQAAQAAIELAEGSGANPAWAYLYLAEAHKRNHDPAQARPAFEKAAQLAPDVDWILFQAGHFYAETGDLAAAEQAFKQMIAVSSSQNWAHSTLAEFYAANNRAEEAVAEYRAALLTNPNAGGTWVALGDTYLLLGQIEAARQSYARAVERDSDNVYARLKYGHFLFTRGELDAVLIQWEAARQRDPQNCDLLLNLGQVYEMLGDSAQALSLYAQVPEFDAQIDPGCRAEAKQRRERLTP
jgi:tetratricopeptide (TPR) repeat protein